MKHVSQTSSLSPGLKFFGSLTNLSIRRSEKSSVKEAAPEHDGKQSVDDMERCLHSPSYATSNEMYTHVGTVPRSQSRRKSSKGLKEKKKKEEEEAEEEEEVERGGQSQRRSGEYVRDSPLLSALSTLSLTSLDRPAPPPAALRPLPSTPALPRHPSPLTSAPESSHREQPGLQSQDAPETVRNMATGGRKVAAPQDVYVPMDPITTNHGDEQTERQRGKSETAESEKEAESSGR